jgi:hypothetical protein
MSRQLSFQKVRRSLLAIPLLAFVAWQPLPLYAQTGETPQPILSPTSPDQVQYRYDATANECRNAAGQKGTNGRVLATCGDLTVLT